MVISLFLTVIYFTVLGAAQANAQSPSVIFVLCDGVLE